ncbi:hypothetical protein [Pontibacter diazotrophicus]|uniref:hypothetical protein n=1 Tax=Pontibacter diazotrophicus TaxID=1400979 RepID=UPI0015F17046|nr:hypothetical protein [Pontibacter diazotrophicus]
MMDRKEHIALVVDKFGGTASLVTMEDITKTLLGLEIADELDAVEDLQKWARERWEACAKGRRIQDSILPETPYLPDRK